MKNTYTHHNFSTHLHSKSTTILTYINKTDVNLSPTYQREGQIWSTYKRQLLIDSIINGFDIPKLYWHALPQKTASSPKYAVIDGKQRLEAIWDFIDNKFPLSEDFELISNPRTKMAGLTFEELGRQYPSLKAEFEGYPLSIVVVETDDTELIEELFSRLNEAVPLSAAEKRNSFPTAMRDAVRKMAKHPFFASHLPFSNSRYRHLELAAKFLLLAKEGAPANTKRSDLDFLVNSGTTKTEVNALLKHATTPLNTLIKVFKKSDALLRNPGTLSALFLVAMIAREEGESKHISRSALANFEERRKLLRESEPRESLSTVDWGVARFNELASTVNDQYAIRERCEILCRDVFPQMKKTLRRFRRSDASDSDA